MLESPSKRLKLERDKVHTERVITNGHLLYISGVWYARTIQAGTGKQKRVKLGNADDSTSADNALFLSYDQAKEKCFEALKALQKELDDSLAGMNTAGNWDVADVIRFYLKKLESSARPNSKSAAKTQANANILPALASIPISKLTKYKLEEWRNELANQPIKNSKKKGFPTDLEGQRKRSSSANKALNVLLAALRYAESEGKIPHGDWSRTKQAKGVEGIVDRFLTPDEIARFLAVIDRDDFRNLVKLALYTGARFQELSVLTVSCWNPTSRKLACGRFGKSRKTRYIPLNTQASAFLNELVDGREPTDILLPRLSARNEKCSRTLKPDVWQGNDQDYFTRKYAKRAGLVPFGFHVLRHTYASLLLQAGTPILEVSRLLGHYNVSITAKHYGHLCPDMLALHVEANGIRL